MFRFLQKIGSFIQAYPVILPLLLFIILTLPFFGIQPCFDGEISFGYAKELAVNGLNSYLHATALHPPGKAFILVVFFRMLGDSIITLNFVSHLHGLFGIVGLYLLAKQLVDKYVVLLSALLLATSGIYLANSFHLLDDYVMTIYILFALYFYAKNNKLLYNIFAGIAVLTKDTALILPASILIVEFFHSFEDMVFRMKPKQILRFILWSFPIAIYSIWYLYVQSNGIDVWHENIFAESKDRGANITIILIVLNWNFLQEWPDQQRAMFFYLNFNWVYLLVGAAGIILYTKKTTIKTLSKQLFKNTHIAKTKLTIIVFSFIYFFTIFTFQTFTAPRYGLPLYSFIYIVVAHTIIRYLHKIPFHMIVIMGLFMTTTLFFSFDPISRILWHIKPISNQQFYGFYHVIDGNDAIIYNLQYPLLLKKKTQTVLEYFKNNQVTPPTTNQLEYICQLQF